MRIAFVGYAGSGKTFIAKKFCEMNPEFQYINIDEFVEDLYKNDEIFKDFIIDLLGEKSYSYSEFLRFKVGDRFPDKKYILEKISKNSKLLKTVEDNCLWTLRGTLNEELHENYVIDGIQAYKYQAELGIDKIIYVSADKNVRRSRFKLKGWSKQKIKLIEKLQKDYIFKKYDELFINNNTLLDSSINLLSVLYKLEKL